MTKQNPFAGQLSFEEMIVRNEAERQESFESRVIERVFKMYGASAKWLATVSRMVNSGAATQGFDFNWFNERAGYPVRFSARRFSAKRNFLSDTLHAIMRPKDWERSPELSAIADLQDGYPGETVCFVSRYPDYGKEVAFHTLVGPRHVDGWRIQPPGAFEMMIEHLDSALLRFKERFEWLPASIVNAE